MPSRAADLRDLGDALLLLDPVDPEPFWNRLEAVRWPTDPDAFDRRLAETAVRFAALARQPHVWVSPPHDAPADLAERLRGERVRGRRGRAADGRRRRLEPPRALRRTGRRPVDVVAPPLPAAARGRRRREAAEAIVGGPADGVRGRGGAPAGDRRRDAGDAGRPALHALPRDGRRRAGRGRASSDVRRPVATCPRSGRSRRRVVAGSAGSSTAVATRRRVRGRQRVGPSRRLRRQRGGHRALRALGLPAAAGAPGPDMHPRSAR